jgi:hypothetical protein
MRAQTIGIVLSNMWRDKWLFLILISAWSVLDIQIFWLLYANCNKGQGHMTLSGKMFYPGVIWDIWWHIFMFTLRTRTWWNCSRYCAARTNNKCSMHDTGHVSASLSERTYQPCKLIYYSISFFVQIDKPITLFVMYL